MADNRIEILMKHTGETREIYITKGTLRGSDVLDAMQEYADQQVRENEDKWENLEASVCPEDVGFVELIKSLRKKVAELEEQINDLDQEKKAFAVETVKDMWNEVSPQVYDTMLTRTELVSIFSNKIKQLQGE